MLEARELNLTLDFCLRVGELLLASGAGVADVTATMQSVAWHLGLRNPEVDVTFTQLSMAYQPDPELQPTFLIRTVKKREIDYGDLTLVDHLVRDVLADRVELKEARARLARIVSSGHVLPRWAVSLGWGAMCAAIGMAFGGGPLVMAIAFVAAVCIDRLQLVMNRRRLPLFYQQVAGGALGSVIGVVASAVSPDLNTSVVVTANIVMLLAGIGFMGALQDALSGFYLTAGARITEAILATAGIIAGVSGGLRVATVLGVDVRGLDPGAVDLRGVTLTAIGAALAAAAFAFASYAPGRILLPVAVVAAIAMLISQSAGTQGFGRTWATGIAAFFVGLVSFTVAGRVRVPPLVVVVPAIVPLLPGLSIYRGLTLLAEGGSATSEGLLAMVTAGSVALALASGVILGEYVAQPLKREARRLEGRLAGPRLVGPLGVHPRRRSRSRGRGGAATDETT